MSSFAAGDALGLHHCPARAIAGCKILVRNAIGAALGVSQQPRGFVDSSSECSRWLGIPKNKWERAAGSPTPAPVPPPKRDDHHRTVRGAKENKMSAATQESRSLADPIQRDGHLPNRLSLNRCELRLWSLMPAWPQPAAKHIPKYVALWSRVFLVTRNLLYRRLRPRLSWLNLRG